jgi:hypothetical protein
MAAGRWAGVGSRYADAGADGDVLVGVVVGGAEDAGGDDGAGLGVGVGVGECDGVGVGVADRDRLGDTDTAGDLDAYTDGDAGVLAD